MTSKRIISCAAEAAIAIHPAFPKSSLGVQECFVVLSLNNKHCPIGRPVMIAMGSVNVVEVHPRDVFRQAVKKNAAAVIVAHNHPSGDTEPSSDDELLTERLVKAGEVLGIPLLDHIVISACGRFVSLADRGLIGD